MGITSEFLFIPLLTAISSFINTATVEGFPGNKHGIITYSSLVAHPSTGKSAATNIILQALSRIEEYNNVSPASSRITNGSSIESILRLLEQSPSLLGI